MADFIRGETRQHAFILPFAPEEIETAVVTYSQRRKPVLEYTVTEFEPVSYPEDDGTEIAGSRIRIHLTQSESLRLGEEIPCFVMINLLLKNGERWASLNTDELQFVPGEQFHAKVIGDG